MTAIAKRVVLLSMLEKNEVMLTCDGRISLVPSQHRGDEILVLRLNYKFPTSMELEATDDALYVTLSFQGKDFRCTIPWGAVYGLRIEGVEDILFLSDVPWCNPEFSGKVLRNGQLAEMAIKDENGVPVPEDIKTLPSKPFLKVVPDEEPE